MMQFFKIITILLLFVLMASATLAADVQVVKKATSKLYGGIETVSYALRAAGITLEADKLPALVSNVRIGSPSAYGGLIANDKVLLASISQDRLNVVFERDGKRYALSVQTSPIDLAKGKPVLDSRSKTLSASISEPQLEQNKYKVVSNYDLVIVIDTSGSMAEPLKTLPLSKWEWCTKFVSSFATGVNPLLNGRGITIVRYSDTHSIHPRCSPVQVLTLLRGTDPVGRTNIGDPLQELLNDFLSGKRDRPLLIALLTDGIPTDGPKVEEVIINATKKMHSKNEVQMMFLEIGEENEGTTLLRYLDNYLVADGAKYDVVSSLAFSELKHLQLVDVLTQMLSEKNELVAGKALQLEIDELKAEIELERKLAKNKRQVRN